MVFLHPNFFFPNQQLSKHLSLAFQTPQVSVKKSRQMWINGMESPAFSMDSPMDSTAGCCLGVVATGASLAVLSRLGDDQVPWAPLRFRGGFLHGVSLASVISHHGQKYHLKLKLYV